MTVKLIYFVDDIIMSLNLKNELFVYSYSCNILFRLNWIWPSGFKDDFWNKNTPYCTYHMKRYFRIWHNIALNHMIPYCRMWKCIVSCETILCRMIWYCIIWYGNVLYDTIFENMYDISHTLKLFFYHTRIIWNCIIYDIISCFNIYCIT